MRSVVRGRMWCVVALSLGCASPPPAPMSPATGGVGIHVATRLPLGLWPEPQGQVLFLRLPDIDDPTYTSGTVYVSNYAKGDYVYLLNARPGRYVAVACWREQSNRVIDGVPVYSAGDMGKALGEELGPTRFTTYLPRPTIQSSETLVEPGCVAFMGWYELDNLLGLDGADETQTFYHGQLATGHEDRSAFLATWTGDNQYRGMTGTTDRGPTAQARFAQAAREDLGDAGWSVFRP